MSVGYLVVDEGYDIMITDISDVFYLSTNTPMGEKIIAKYTDSIDAEDRNTDKFQKLMKERISKFEMKFNTDVI